MSQTFPLFIPLNKILGITSTLYAYEDGMARKSRNVGTKSSEAGRLPQKTQYCIQHTAKVWNQD